MQERDQNEAETRRRTNSMLKDDFLNSNGQKQLDNKNRREAEREDYHRNKLDYFPFVSGEMLDQHRQGLTGQMRADLKNYLIAKS